MLKQQYNAYVLKRVSKMDIDHGLVFDEYFDTLEAAQKALEQFGHDLSGSVEYNHCRFIFMIRKGFDVICEVESNGDILIYRRKESQSK